MAGGRPRERGRNRLVDGEREVDESCVAKKRRSTTSRELRAGVSGHVASLDDSD